MMINDQWKRLFYGQKQMLQNHWTEQEDQESGNDKEIIDDDDDDDDEDDDINEEDYDDGSHLQSAQEAFQPAFEAQGGFDDDFGLKMIIQ